MGKIPDGAQEVYHGILFDVYQKEIEQFDGSVKTHERLRWTDAVKAICIVDGKIVLISEKQPGGIVKSHALPWWMIERWENHAVAIVREVHEEIGITFSSVELLAAIPISPAAMEAYRYLYVCKGPSSYDLREENNAWWSVSVILADFDEFLLAMQNHYISDISYWIIRNYILPGKEEDLRKLLFW